MDIREILGISEMYEFIRYLKDIIFDKQRREEYFNKIIEDIDLRTDFIRDVFQAEAAQRKQMKQDYTPDCICKLFYELSTTPAAVLDECAGTGSLAISYIANGVKNVICIEKSETVFPLLLFNMSIRNVTGWVIKEDITTRELLEAYRLEAGTRYSDIAKLEPNIGRVQTIISNPPYSLPWSGVGDWRFRKYAVPPKSKGDYLFIIDILTRLKDGGEAFVLLPHGVLFRGNQELAIRRSLIEKRYIHGIIGLPDNMFLNTSIPNVMICLKKADTESVYIMDATKYATKKAKVNELDGEAVHEIAKNYKNRIEKAKISRLVSIEEIQANQYNLNIPRYIDTTEPEEQVDIRKLTAQMQETDEEIRKTERELAGMMRQLVGDCYQSDIAEVLKLWS